MMATTLLPPNASALERALGAASATYGVAWTIAGTAISDGEAINAAFGAAQTITDTGGTANAV